MKGKTSMAISSITVILIAQSFFNLLLLFRSIFWNYGLNYSDPLILATSGILYKSISTYPYILTYYTPLSYLLVRAFAMLAPQFVSTNPYFYMKILDIFAVAAVSVLIFAITNNLSSKKYAALATAFFLSSTLLLQYGTSFSPIFLELAFDLLAVYLMIKPGGKKVAYAAVSLFIAFMFRQSAIVIFAALLIYLLIERRFKLALGFSAIFLVSSAVAVFSINALTGGRFILEVIELPLITPALFKIFLLNLFDFIKSTYSAAFALLALGWFFLFKKRNSLISVLLVVTGISTLSSAKYGATIVYFTPFLAFLGIAAALGASEISHSKAKGTQMLNPRVAMSYTVAMFLLLLAFNSAYYKTLYIYNGTVPSADKIGFMLRNVSGPILAEDPEVYVAAGKPILFEPSVFWVLQAHGMWNDSRIVSSVDNCSFGAIVFPEGYDRFLAYPRIINATIAHYEQSYSKYGWIVMEPRKSC
ncbi:MAG: hypothetical protein ACP5K9_01425 [Candidatus Micrarchaeia archaeon]